MSSLLSQIPLMGSLIRGSKPKAIPLSPVQVHSIETAPEKRPRTLKHLLRANHVNHAILYNHLEFHNHMPHILCSAYLLGANDTQLHKIYDEDAKFLEPWTESPSEITETDWRGYLGDGRFQRAYVDFFEDCLAMKHNYDWKKVVEEFIFDGPKPLIHCLIGGLGHPLIHLGFAYEMDNKEIAMEALGLAATQYNFLHKYLDDPSYTKDSPQKSSSIMEILDKIRQDTRLDGIFKKRGFGNFNVLFEQHEDLVMEYWNAWVLDDPVAQFRESQQVAMRILVDTVDPSNKDYNFFNCHLLTTSHAVRVLLPYVPEKFHVNLVREWWLLTLAVYVSELRPPFDWKPRSLDAEKTKDWSYVEYLGREGRHANDTHYVKALRAMKEAALTWGDDDKEYVNTAVQFADEFDGWVFT